MSDFLFYILGILIGFFISAFLFYFLAVPHLQKLQSKITYLQDRNDYLAKANDNYYKEAKLKDKSIESLENINDDINYKLESIREILQ